MKINIDEIRQAESTLEDINEEIREARFHDDKEREEFMLKEKRETLEFLALAEKEKHATFTPGPWQIEDCTPGESTGLRFEVGTKDSVIARTTDGWKEAHANARLIAAAPEMYEILQEVERVCLKTPEIGEKLREVLAKVDGGEA